MKKGPEPARSRSCAASDLKRSMKNQLIEEDMKKGRKS
jgi:hypothetical protein